MLDFVRLDYANMEPLDLYKGLQPLVLQDIKHVMGKELSNDKYRVVNTQLHTHNGTDSAQIPFANLLDAPNYRSIQRKTLTPTQVKALNTTPITLVPAPVATQGTTAKSVLIVEGITAYLSYGGTAYTGANALEFRYTDGSGAKVTADVSTTFLNATSNKYVSVAGVTTELVPVANAPIVVRVPTADPGAGNSPITFIVFYRQVSFQ